ncbi:lipopolysaccharide biosynthesis protein [Rurimicrobium arvi]|uniref:Membrane protein involved in the export of O-antigen and teichoic acid n=1 Tax=Rurimicrobium arvi TaxID=2049916 RepID=A0ABP8MSU5_9BACT
MFPALALFICWIVASRYLHASTYGVYQSFWIQLSTLSTVVSLGFPTFIFNYPGDAAIKIIRSVRRNHLLIYIVCVLLAALIFAALQHHDGLSLAAAITLLLWVACNFVEALLLALRGFRPAIFINGIYAVMLVAVHVYLLENTYPLAVLCAGIAIALAFRVTAGLWVLHRIHRRHAYEEHGLDLTGHQTLWKQLALNDTIQVLFRWIDKFILSLILMKAIFAVYVNASIEVPFLPILFAAATGAAVQHWASGKPENRDSLSVLHQASRLLAAIVFPLFAFLMLFRNEFLTTLFSAHYASGVWIFVCAQLVLPLRAFPFTSMLQSHKRGDIITRGAVWDFVIACVAMYPLYLLLGLPGVALSFVLSTYWQAAYYLRQTSDISGIPVRKLVPFRTLILRLLLALTCFTIYYYLLRLASLSINAMFLCGAALLLIYSGIALWREWTSEKHL